MRLSNFQIQLIAKKATASILAKRDEEEEKLKSIFFGFYEARAKRMRSLQAIIKAYNAAPKHLKSAFHVFRGLYFSGSDFKERWVEFPEGKIAIWNGVDIELTALECIKVRPIVQKIEKLLDEHAALNKELRLTLSKLGTDKRIIESFPELAKFMPVKGNTSTATYTEIPNLVELRKKLKSL